MAFKRSRRERTGKYTWRNYGKNGFSTTTKHGSRTTTTGPKGTKSTYHYADGLSQSTYSAFGKGIRRQSRRGRSGGAEAGGGILIAVIAVLAFVGSYPLVAVGIIICSLLGAVVWFVMREGNEMVVTEREETQNLEEESAEDDHEHKDSDDEPGYKETTSDHSERRPWFEALGVSPNASRKDIKAARDKYVHIYHPDRLRGDAPDIVALANKHLAEVNAAYEEALEQCVADSEKVEDVSKAKMATPEPSLSHDFGDFIADTSERLCLENAIAKARNGSEALGHTLMVGPSALSAGTGKIIARELHRPCRLISGSAVKKAADLAALLTNMETCDILIISDIHALKRAVAEVLYRAMKDFKLDLIVDEEPTARTVELDLSRFTVICSTSAQNRVPKRLREEFKFVVHLE